MCLETVGVFAISSGYRWCNVQPGKAGVSVPMNLMAGPYQSVPCGKSPCGRELGCVVLPMYGSLASIPSGWAQIHYKLFFNYENRGKLACFI